jgi:MFS family permease
MIITWKAPFYTFAVVLVILIIVIIGVPKSPPSKTNSDDSEGNEKTKLPGFAYIYTALMALVWLFAFTTIVTALFVTSEKLFAPQLIGFAVSSPGVGCMIGGLLFPVMFRTLKKNIMTVSLVIYALGYLCLFFSNGFVMLIIGNVLIGIGQGSMVAYIYCATAHKARSRAEKDMSLGLVSCAIGISAILQPFFMAAVGAINPGFATPYRFLFFVGIIGLAIWAILAFITRKDLGEPGMKAN